MDTRLATYLALIFLSAVAGALPPLLGKWSQRQLHLFVAFGAGVFLSATFFHLLPDALTADAGRWPQFTIFAGFLMVLVTDRVILARLAGTMDSQEEGQHRAIGVTALVGLCLHSVTAGISLGLGQSHPETAKVIFLAILSHKAVAAFSLATIFRLSKIPLTTTLWMLAIFALSTPLGTLAALPLVPLLSDWNPAIPESLATGTFMYVAIMNLLPEAFHDAPRRPATVMALGAGIVVMAVLSSLGG